MFEIDGRSRLYDVTRVLVDTAMGRDKADLVVRNGSLVNVNSGEIIENQGIAIKNDRIALVGNVENTIGPDTQVIDAHRKWVAPGFIDGHVHVESAMVAGTEFARAVIPHGTTTVFIDPHEMANVLGMDGVRFFINEARGLPLKMLITFPSCVPAAPGFETSGASFGPKEIEEAMSWKEVVALGEMMNYPGVLAADPNVHAEIAATLKTGRVVEGHAVDLLDRDLGAYASAGITSCHESTEEIQAIQKLRNGMYAMLREASGATNVANTIKAVTRKKLDSRHACLVTDDREPSDLVNEGQVDYVIRRAIQEGVDPIEAIQMATLNVAEHYECARELGNIAPARFADIVILDKLETVSVNTVIADGKVVSQNGKLTAHLPTPTYPEAVMQSMHLKRPPNLEDLAVRTKTKNDTVRVRAIGVLPTNILTHNLESEVPVNEGKALTNPHEDVAKIAVFERHRGSGNVAVGFVKGLGLKEGAVASTVGHDCHNLVVAGMDDASMIAAANLLAQSGGGMVAVKDQKPLSHLPLPIAGLMSDKSVETVSRQMKELKDAWSRLGSKLPSPTITLAFTTLSVIPELRITDKGVLDTVQFKFVNPIIE
ncbi:MAG: adenine deaminase [Candidatus Bathyarchaeia archaeon]|jgi:adenine deaminase